MPDAITNYREKLGPRFDVLKDLQGTACMVLTGYVSREPQTRLGAEW